MLAGMPRRRRHAAALVVGALSLVACSSGDDDATSTSASSSVSTSAAPTTTPTTTPSTSAAPTTSTPPSSTTPTTSAPADTTTPTTDPPTPSTEPGEPDWIEVTQGLFQTLHELRLEPSVEGIDRYCALGETSCNASTGQEIRRLVDEGWRAIGLPPPVVISATRLATESDRPVAEAFWVQVRTVLERQDLSEAFLVDENDDVVFNLTSSDEEDEVIDMVLQRGPDGWRVLGTAEPDS